METLWFTHFQEGLGATISWKDDGNSILGFGGNFAHGLHATEDSSH
jgi:hypothetical protein